MKTFVRHFVKWRIAPLLVAITLGLSTAALAPFALAASGLRLQINGTSAPESVKPMMLNNTVYVPLRAISEKLGIGVGWLPDTRTVRLSNDDSVVYVRVGENSALVNGNLTKLPQAARTVDGQVVVPLRFVSDLLGLEVDYQSKNGIVNISGAQYRVTSVAFANEDGYPVITLTADGPIQLKTAGKSENLTFDVIGGRIKAGAPPTETGDPIVQRISWEQVRPTLGRITLALSRPAPYTIVAQPDHPNQVKIRFQRQLRSANLTKDAHGELLDIGATGPFTVSHVSTLSNPDRVVLDLGGLTLAAKDMAQLGDAWVKSIRFGQSTPDTVRVVLDTVGPVAVVQSPGQSGTPSFRLLARVSDVSVSTQKSQTRITVSAGVPISADAVVSRTPARIALRIPGAVLDKPRADLTPKDGTVDSVRTSQETPDQVLVTAELPYYAGHKVTVGVDGTAMLDISRSPVFGRRIFLDAGHGGSDPGAIGPGGLHEKDANLDITLRLGEILKEAGAEVSYARTEDVFIPLHDRPRLANDLGADIFVSVHNNANVKSQEGGTETYYHPEHAYSQALAESVQRELLASTGLFDRRIKVSRELVVLKESQMAAILIEGAFVSNPNEEKLLADPDYRTKEAAAIAQGIQSFFQALPPGAKLLDPNNWPGPAASSPPAAPPTPSTPSPAQAPATPAAATTSNG